MKIKGAETFFGEIFDTTEEFIKNLYKRVNKVYSTVMDEDDKMNQLTYLIGFLTALIGKDHKSGEKEKIIHLVSLDNAIEIIRG